MKSVPALIMATLALALIVGGSFYGGRAYQNSIDQRIFDAYSPTPIPTMRAPYLPAGCRVVYHRYTPQLLCHAPH